MHMIGHQHPTPHRNALRRAMFGEQIAVERVILITKKGLRPPVTALSDMVRDAGNDEAGEAGHAGKARAMRRGCQLSALSP